MGFDLPAEVDTKEGLGICRDAPVGRLYNAIAERPSESARK